MLQYSFVDVSVKQILDGVYVSQDIIELDEIKSLVSKNELMQAIKKLKPFLPDSSALLLRRFHVANKKALLNLALDSVSDLEKQRIATSILEYATEIWQSHRSSK